jgi:putative zinc finger protein
MAERHVEALFALACDGRLDPAARRRFEAHLASCERCALGFADHSAAADALRGLPPARMPVPVRLPTHAPRAAHTGLIQRLGLRSPMGVSVLGLSAAAAALVVGLVAVHYTRGQQAGSNAALAQGALSSSASSSGAVAPDFIQAPATPAPFGAGGGTGSAGFAYRTSAQGPGRPGEVLVLATALNRYAPGATVMVEAQLVPASSPAIAAAPAPAQAGGPAHAGATPQPTSLGVSSSGIGASIPSVLALPTVSLLSGAVPEDVRAPAAGAAAPPSPTPVAVAVPAGGPGLFTVTIPATARPGDVLTIVATVPAGDPSAADTSPITAVLQIVVG